MIGQFIRIVRGMHSTTSVSGFQTDKQITPDTATIVARNQEVCRIDGRLVKGSYDMSVAFANESYLIKFFEQSNSIETIGSIVNAISSGIKNKSAAAFSQEIMPKIYDANGQIVGAVIPEDNTTYNNNRTVKYSINGVILNIYFITLGKIAICNEQDQLVGIIGGKEKGNASIYDFTFYSASDEWFKYVALVAAIMERFYEKRDMVLPPAKDPEILAKYDQNFINQIIAKEGPQNLPENMPMVAQKRKERHDNKENAIGRRIFLITLAISVIAFILLFAVKGCGKAEKTYGMNEEAVIKTTEGSYSIKITDATVRSNNSTKILVITYDLKNIDIDTAIRKDAWNFSVYDKDGTALKEYESNGTGPSVNKGQTGTVRIGYYFNNSNNYAKLKFTNKMVDKATAAVFEVKW